MDVFTSPRLPYKRKSCTRGRRSEAAPEPRLTSAGGRFENERVRNFPLAQLSESLMTNVLIVLTLPEPVRMQYFNHVKDHFPEVKLDMVDHHSKVDPYIGAAEVLITFGPHVANHVFEKAKSLKWVQALGTGVDGIADQPGLRRDVLLTNMHGFHGAPVSEAALLSMLALARGLPRSLRTQAKRRWDRFPVKLLKGKTVGIFGIGTIAAELAPKCKALGMKVVGVSSAKRKLEGFDAMFGREELAQAVKDWDYFVLLTPFTPETKNIVDAKIFAKMKPSACLDRKSTRLNS